jgi:hypothetical protein
VLHGIAILAILACKRRKAAHLGDEDDLEVLGLLLEEGVGDVKAGEGAAEDYNSLSHVGRRANTDATVTSWAGKRRTGLLRLRSTRVEDGASGESFWIASAVDRSATQKGVRNVGKFGRGSDGGQDKGFVL